MGSKKDTRQESKLGKFQVMEINDFIQRHQVKFATVGDFVMELDKTIKDLSDYPTANKNQLSFYRDVVLQLPPVLKMIVAEFNGENGFSAMAFHIEYAGGSIEPMPKHHPLKKSLSKFLKDEFDFDAGVEGKLSFTPTGNKNEWMVEGNVQVYSHNEESDDDEFGEDIYDTEVMDKVVLLDRNPFFKHDYKFDFSVFTQNRKQPTLDQVLEAMETRLRQIKEKNLSLQEVFGSPLKSEEVN